jgi:adenylate cyclase
MPEEQKPPEEDRGLHADPLYLRALASLGTSVPAKLIADPAKGSIAVLPFLNMSGDPEQEHFTDGLTEDIITDLSNVSGFFVIARNSTFAYKGKPTDVRQIAQDLGVKYILEGSARRSAQRLRINVQLIDAANGGNHIWAERFDRDLADIFEVQDEVTRRVVEAITGKLNASPILERYRPTNLEAYDLVVRSRWQFLISQQACLKAQTMLERAIKLDANYPEAHWLLAMMQFCNWIVWNGNPEPDRRSALISARRAVELAPNEAWAYGVLGNVLMGDLRWDEAKIQFEHGLRLNPNDADIHIGTADYYICIGEPHRAMEYLATALRLNPHPPNVYFWKLGMAQISIGHYAEAVVTLRREETYGTGSRRNLIAALALLGRIEEAKEEAKLFVASNPQWTIGSWVDTVPFRTPEHTKIWVDALRLAGLPE